MTVQMNPWLWAAGILLLALIGPLIVTFRGKPTDRLVGLEFASVIITIDMLLFVEGFHRATFYDLPLTLAFLSFGGGMVFARFYQRWL